MSYISNNAQAMTLALHGQWHGKSGLACCPAHEDRKPSLSLSNGNDGRLLVHCHAGCSFQAIIEALRLKGLIDYNNGTLRNDFAKNKTYHKINSYQSTRHSEIAQKIWHEARPISGTLAEYYLQKRGIDCALPNSLRFHKRCYHISKRYYPAMLALIEGGEGFAIHRTYLAENGTKAAIEPNKAMLGHVVGGGVHLKTYNNNRLLICEGIETGLSLACGMLAQPANIWAALSATHMKNIKLPMNMGELIIAVDNDEAGLNAGHALALRALENGWQVKTITPPAHQDFNDVLLQNKKGGAA